MMSSIDWSSHIKWSEIMIVLPFAQVQINNNIKNDTFTELPVSLVLFSLICIDVVERIRHCRLTGQGERSSQTASHKSLTECCRS